MSREYYEIEVTHYTQEGRSGAALYVFNLVEALARRGVSVNLLCPENYDYSAQLSGVEGVRVQASLPSLDGLSGKSEKLWRMLQQAITGLRMTRALRRGAIVHVNFPGLIFFAAPLLVGFRLFGLKVLLTVHDVLPHHWLLPKPLRVLELASLLTMYLAASRIVVHHQEAEDLLHERFAVPREKVSIIPHGPFKVSGTPPTYKESDEITALLFGSLRENKSILASIKAVQELRASKVPVRLVVAGRPYASEAAYWQRCVEEIATAPDGISVEARYLEDEEVKSIISEAHLFLLPYKDFRSQSGVASLALSNGRPIVATRAGGLSELLIPGRTGFPIEQPTVDGIKQGLEQAVRIGHEGLVRMGREGLDFFAGDRSWSAITDDYIGLYRDLCKRSKGADRENSSVVLYRRMLRRWMLLARGKSYWHQEQELGERFVPGELAGYYNDLAGKTRWDGPVDDAGLPLNETLEGKLVHFPTSVLQKALGHWDRWLQSDRKDDDHYDQFIRSARWALDSQDKRGGWPIWPLLGLHYASPYSAMTQGEGISVLARAFLATGEEAYLDGARLALSPLLTEVSDGGTCRRVPEGLVLEEVPLHDPATILNGWIFALYGLYDLSLVDGSLDVAKALEESLDALVAYLPEYDAGFWSYYDTRRNLASPFYHRLHVAQLRALELTFPECASVFALSREIFERQLTSRLNRSRALALKVIQKLRRPPDTVLR